MNPAGQNNMKPKWMLIPELADKEKLAELKATYRSNKIIAKNLGIGRHSVEQAIRYHGLQIPFGRTDPQEATKKGN